MTPLPCPFCGEVPFVGPENPSKDGNAFGFVECRNQSCVTFHAVYGGLRVMDGELVSDERGSDGYKAIAIARWNRRIT